VYDCTLKLSRRIAPLGNAADAVDRGVDFDVAADGTLWVADETKKRVVALR